MIVDAQVHLWPAETPERPWPPGAAARAHLPTPLTYPDMLGRMDAAGVDRAIIVPPSWEGDRNDYALEAATRHPDRFAVMGRIKLDDPAARSALPRWLETPGMLGVRTMFSRKQAAWLDDGTTDWFWPVVEHAGIPVMAHGPGLADKFAALAVAHPKLRLIIDHMNLSSEIKKAGTIPAAIAAVAALARHPNISVKVSSVPSYSSQAYPFADMTVHVRTIVEAFGAERCYWGSDLTHAHGRIAYQHYVSHFTEHLDFLTPDQKKLIMGESLLRVLGWRS